MDFLSVCAIFRDEASYLDEWLTFHSFIGVDRFYLYNHRSVDNYPEVLEPWIRAGKVILLDAKEKEGRDAQQLSYRDCIKKVRFSSKWVAFIDLDEFLWSPSAEGVREVLNDFPRAAGLAVRWVLFGSNGHEKRPKEGVLRSFTKCLPVGRGNEENALARDAASRKNRVPVTGRYFQGKSIVNPRRIIRPGIHLPKLYFGKVVNEDGSRLPLLTQFRKIRMEFWSSNQASRIRVNHYWSKSIEELNQKVERRNKSDSNLSASKRVSLEESLPLFLNREGQLNQHEDMSLHDLWPDALSRRASFLSPSQSNQ